MVVADHVKVTWQPWTLFMFGFIFFRTAHQILSHQAQMLLIDVLIVQLVAKRLRVLLKDGDLSSPHSLRHTKL